MTPPEIRRLGQLVPGPASAGTQPAEANNNLDIVVFKGRMYIAWRTAPTHFASAAARIEISSIRFDDSEAAASPLEDQLKKPWRHEASVRMGADVREPRFATTGERLMLFFMELGTDPRRFQPRRTWRVGSSGNGKWSDPVVAIADTIVPWRIRQLGERFVLTSYRGAERMYSLRPADTVVELRFSDDLRTWSEPMPIHVGGTECELVELPDGNYFGVTRNEGPSHFGSDVLYGRSFDALSRRPVAPKLDSPYLFMWDGEPWLIARRSLSRSGRYGIAPHRIPGTIAIRVNQLAWSLSRKRSALWRLDPDRSSVKWVADLPSRGDTSFAGVIERSDGSLLVADYTSPESSGDPVWVAGQLQPTVIQLLAISRPRATSTIAGSPVPTSRAKGSADGTPSARRRKSPASRRNQDQ